MPRQHGPGEYVLNKRALYGRFPAPKYQADAEEYCYWYSLQVPLSATLEGSRENAPL